MSCGGTGLVGYSDSSEEESGGGEGKDGDDESPPRKKHRGGSESRSPPVAMAVPHTTLPLPTAILEMFNEEDSPVGAKEDGHEGRVRTFPHVRGNWATFVFIPISLSGELQTCITALHNYLMTTFAPCVGSPQFHMMSLSDSHVSLSRTVAIQHHWIDPLTELLRDKIRRRQGFTLGFSDLTFYCNDEKTRSFLGLEVSLGHAQVFKGAFNRNMVMATSLPCSKAGRRSGNKISYILVDPWVHKWYSWLALSCLQGANVNTTNSLIAFCDSLKLYTTKPIN